METEKNMNDDFKGYEDLGKTSINCLGCGKNLMKIWRVKEDPEYVTNIKVHCCYCDDDSGKNVITGTMYVGAGDDVSSVEMFDCEMPSGTGEQMVCVYSSFPKQEK